MYTQTIIFETVIIAFCIYLLCEFFKNEKQLEKEAKKSVETFNRMHHTSCKSSEFVKIHKRNPDWLSLDVNKQKELIKEHGYTNLMYRCCF